MSQGHKKISRRELIRGSGRLLLLGTVTYFSVKLLRKSTFRRSESCINDFICRGCTAYSGCGLPQALSARRALGDGKEPNG